MITMSLLIILRCFTKNTLSICNVPYMLGLNCPSLSWLGLIELDTLMEMKMLNCLTDERMCSEKKAKNLKWLDIWSLYHELTRSEGDDTGQNEMVLDTYQVRLLKYPKYLLKT